MVSFNYQAKEVAIKIVYYGPGLCGKTTSLQYIYDHLPENGKGKMVSLSTQTDRTLFFDFLPFKLGKVKGLETKMQLYTVPGQVFYNQTRRIVLKGVDGIVFVADSQLGMLEANRESFENLIQNLSSLGMKIDDIPLVFQYNKIDLPNLIDVETLNKELNKFNAPYFETSAITGEGIIETLREIVRLTLNNIREKNNVEIDEMIDEDEVEKVKKVKDVKKDEETEEQLNILETKEPEEISVSDLEDMDTDVFDFSVDLDENILDEEQSADEESIELIDEVEEVKEESIEEIGEEEFVEEDEDLDNVEEYDEYETMKVDSEVIEDRIETIEIKEDVDKVEVEAPRIIKAENGYFVPIKIKIPEGMEDDVRINLDLKIEIKKKKR